jgi:hypothetical protein
MKYIIGILSFLLLLAVVSGVYVWYKTGHSVLNTTTYTPAPQIKVVTKIKTVKVPVKEVITIEKEVIVEKLKLPDWIKNNADEQAIATAAIPAYKGTTNAVAVLNTKTGSSQIVAKQEPMSLFGFANEKEIGVRAGIDVKGATVSSVYGRWDFARVGSVYVGVYGDASFGSNVSSSGDAKVQLNIGYKF